MKEEEGEGEARATSEQQANGNDECRPAVWFVRCGPQSSHGHQTLFLFSYLRLRNISLVCHRQRRLDQESHYLAFHIHTAVAIA